MVKHLKKVFKSVFILVLVNFFQSCVPQEKNGTVRFYGVGDMGEVGLGEEKDRAFRLDNQTLWGLTLKDIVLKDSDAFLFKGGSCERGIILEPNKSCTLEILFRPSFSGYATTSLEVYLENQELEKVLVRKVTLEGMGVDDPNPPSPPSPPVAGWPYTDGPFIYDGEGDTLILRGVSIPDPQHLNTKTWTRPGISAQSLAARAIDEFKVNVIRIPVLPGDPKYPTEGWHSPSNGREKYFEQHLDPLVKYITSRGVYAIIDWHYISDFLDLEQETLEFWQFIAPKYLDNPKVIFEIFNEPIFPDDWRAWKDRIAQPVVDQIKSTNAKNLIIVGGPYWTSHMADAASDPITGGNIIYAAHAYSNQSPSAWERNFGPLIGRYPLFVTEWGFEKEGTEGGTQSGFGEPFLNWMETYGMSWTAWNFDNVWGPRIFDDQWNLRSGDGGMGDFVKKALEKND